MFLKEAIMAYIEQLGYIHIYIYMCVCVCVCAFIHGDSSSGRCKDGNEGNKRKDKFL